MEGGYDTGYRDCPCFWGKQPGRLVTLLQNTLRSFEGMRVLDAGAGEGKNAASFAERGAQVDAVEVSSLALRNARAAYPKCAGVNWIEADIRQFHLEQNVYDVVVAYGLFHCFSSLEEVAGTVQALKEATRRPGHHVICAFNNRHQDLSAHPAFAPLLLEHQQYLDLYNGWHIEYVSDEDLHETHPHNGIPHTHSMTRIIARR